MKKSATVVMIALAILSLFVVSCGSDPFFHTVIVKDGDTIIDNQVVYDNVEYKLPAEPSKRGQVFEGWKSNGGYNLKAGATVKITADVTFTAVWGDTINTPDISSIQAQIDSGKNYKSTETIAFTSEAGTTLRWTLDGSEPTATTETTGNEISLANVAGKITIKIVAEKAGYLSETATLQLNVEPVITFDDYSTVKLGPKDSVKLTVPAGTSVYYTTDGSTPTTESTSYDSATGIPLTGLTGTTTIKVLAIKDEIQATEELTINVLLPEPEINADKEKTYDQEGKISLDNSSIADTTKVIHYTLDGTEPTKDSPVYSATDGIKLDGYSGNVTIKTAIFKEDGERCSDISNVTVKVQPSKPTATVSTTPYSETDNIPVTGMTGTSIYYTTDESTPTASSTEATNGEIPLTGLSGKVTIKAIAVKDGIVSEVKEIKDVQVKPTISFDKQKNEVVSVDGAVKINVPSGTTVYYTTDGITEPKTSSTKYNSETGIPLTGLSGKTTIKVLADNDGVTSTGEIVVDVKLPGPTVNASTTETYKQTDKVTINVPSGTEVRYTIDGENPTATSTKYDSSTGIKLAGYSGNVAIKAATYKDGVLCSAISNITVKVQPSKPTATVSTTPYAETDNIPVTGMTGTSIYYTTNGNTPTTSSPVATDGKIPLSGLSGKVTIKAISVKDGIVSEVNEIKDVQVKPATLTFTKPETAYSVTDKITFSSLDSATKVYYTTDGSTPTTDSSSTTTKTETDGHSIALTGLSGKVTIKAIAVKDNVVSELATFTDVEVKPTISFDTEAGKSVGKNKTVKLTVPSGTTVYYTTDNSDPKTSTTKATYSDATGISLSGLIGNKTIKVYADKDGVGATSELSIKVIPATPTTSADSDEITKAYTTNDKITVTVPTGSEAYYTFGDSVPTTASPKYNGTGISLENQAGQVKLNVIIKEGDEISEVRTITVKVQPTISFDGTAEGSDVGTDESIKIKVPTGTTAYYTTDGSDPSDESNTNRKLYTEAGISVADKNGNTTIKVHADKDGVTADKTLSVTVKPAAPATSADEDESTKVYTKADNITVTVPTGTTCYYTLDGTDPTATTNTGRKTYDGTGISLDGQSGEVKIKVMVTKDGQNSKVKELTIKVKPTVTLLTSASSTSSPLDQTGIINVTVPDPTKTSIYYTTDGSSPTVTGTKASGTTIPVAGLVGDYTVKVLAVKDGVCSEISAIEISVNANKPEIKEDTSKTYKQTDKVTIDVPAGAEVRYTINGAAPTATTGTVYDSTTGISLSENSGNVVIKAVVCKDGKTCSDVSTTTVKVQPATPDVTVEAAPYATTDKLTVSTSYDADTKIYYTTDGNNPTTSSTEATNGEIPLTGLSGNVTIKVIAVKNGIISEVKELKDVKVKPAITFNATTTAELTTTDTISITVSDTSNTKLYYTTDGSNPTIDETGVATGTTVSTTDGLIPMSGLAGNVTVKVLAVKDGVKSDIKTQEVKVKPEVSFGTTAGTELEPSASIAVTAPTGATVYYTTDGTDPTSATTTTGTSIPLTGLVGNATIKVLAVKDDVTSGVKQLLVKVKPTISFDYATNANVRQDQEVTVTVADGVNVYYTTNGDEPTTSSPKTTDGKIDLSEVSTGAKTIKILAEKDGVKATSELTINVKLALPVVSADETTIYKQSDSITITVPSEASVYYTTDGTDPANASNASRKKYSTAISLDGLSGEVKLRAVVVKGSETSDEKSLTLKVQPKTPMYIGATKTDYAESEALAFDVASDADTYYTLDGSDPTTSTTRKPLDSRKSISLSGSLNGAETGTVTVRVVSIKNNVASEETSLDLNVNSKVVTITYVLDGGTITATSYETNAIKGSNTSITLLTASQVSKTGYVLDGWYTESTPSTTNYAGTSVTLNNDNVTLYAHWVDNLTYTVNKDFVSVSLGTVTGNIVIPSIYHGKTVTTVNAMMCQATSVYIPSTVTTISDFSMSQSLETITIEGNSVTSLGNGVFEACDALEMIIFKANKESVKDVCSTSNIKALMGNSSATPTIIYGDTHTVTVYNTDESVLVDTYYVDADETVSKPTVEPTGIASDKIFKFWTADGTTEFEFGKTITEDIELRPYVKAREKLTLTYELNGGTTSEACTNEITEGVGSSEITLLTASQVSKTGYVLDGWYTESTPSTTNYAGTSVTLNNDNVTLYAHWVDEKLSFDTTNSYISVSKANSEITGDVVIPSVYQGKIVTELEASAFAKTAISSISIPDSVTTIGALAFRECTGLTEIKLPSGVTTFDKATFYGCSNLTSINIPSGMTTVPVCTGEISAWGISADVFYGCSKLETITFDDGSKVSSIEDGAFAGCTGLKLILFNSNSADVALSHTDADVDKWTGNLTPRPEVRFKDSHKITYLNEDGSVFSTKYVAGTTTKISEIPVITQKGKIFAFWSEDGSNEYQFGQTITEDIVLKPAVKDGKALTYVLNGGKITASSYVTEADSATPITVLTASEVSKDGYQFDGWYTKNPEDVTISAADVQASYYSDPTVTLTESVILYANWVTDKLTYTDNSGTISVKAKDLSITGEVVIPRVYQGKLVTAIDDAAFYNYNNENAAKITSVVIPDSVESIGLYAFFHTSLEKVKFTGISKLKVIQGGTFAYCESLSEINIPSSVEAIKGTEEEDVSNGAFEGCEKLTADILDGTCVQTIGNQTFYDAGFTKITIPSTVTSIGIRAFCSCASLETVIFARSVAGKTCYVNWRRSFL